MSGILSVTNSDMIVFNAFDTKFKKLLYTKYNFDYTKYKTEALLPSTTDNLSVFKHFLNLNGTTWDKPYWVKSAFKKYFLPITPLIESYVNAYGNTTHSYYRGNDFNSNYVDYLTLVKEQFSLKNYSDANIRFEQDFFVYDTKKNLKYTKWNFNFGLYSEDFNIWGSKLLVFTDFVYRAVNISILESGKLEGYYLPEMFEKYFINDPNLDDYIIYSGVSSPFNLIYNNTTSISWTKYSVTNKVSVSQAKYHFYTQGQFEMNDIFFDKGLLSNYKKIGNAVVTIKNGKSSCNGFLYSPFNDKADTNVYLVTCYHIIKDSPNLNVLRAYSSMFSTTYNSTEPFVLTVDFEIIGYDIYSDILVAKYNKEIPYNVVNNVDLQIFYFYLFAKRLNDYLGLEPPTTGTTVFSPANLGSYSNSACYKGTVVDNKFSGYNNYKYTLAPPDSLIVYFDSQIGSSGSPIFTGDPSSTDRTGVKIVGMINSRCQTLEDHTQCISFFHLVNMVHSIIKKQSFFNAIDEKNLVLKNYVSKYCYTHKWLGAIFSYYNIDKTIEKYPEVNNLYYSGGVIIEKFIIGFNYNTKKFVTDEIELSQLNTIRIETPLLKSLMYRRFIESSKTPIVIKSVSFYNKTKSEYKTYYLGKYGEQESLSALTYDFDSTTIVKTTPETFFKYFSGTIEMPDNLLFKYFSLYGSIDIEYYYYNSTEWILEREKIGGNSIDWFNTYKDKLGYTYFQHKFEYPYILLPYLDIYEDRDSTVSKNFKKLTNAKKLETTKLINKILS